MLLTIMGYSQLLAPDIEQNYYHNVLSALKSICLSTFRFMVLIDELLEILLSKLINCLLLNFFRGTLIYLEIYFGILDFMYDILSSKLMFVYTYLAYILENISLYVDFNMYIWFLRFESQITYRHTGYSVVATFTSRRVVLIPEQRVSILLLSVLVARATLPVYTCLLHMLGNIF